MKKAWVWFTAALLTSAGAGCGSGDVSDPTASESSPVIDEAAASACNDDFESQVLDWSEPSALGYGADDALAALGAEYRATLTHADGSRSR